MKGRQLGKRYLKWSGTDRKGYKRLWVKKGERAPFTGDDKVWHLRWLFNRPCNPVGDYLRKRASTLRKCQALV